MLEELVNNLKNIERNIKWIKIEVMVFGLLVSFGLGVMVGLILG